MSFIVFLKPLLNSYNIPISVMILDYVFCKSLDLMFSYFAKESSNKLRCLLLTFHISSLPAFKVLG